MILHRCKIKDVARENIFPDNLNNFIKRKKEHTMGLTCSSTYVITLSQLHRYYAPEGDFKIREEIINEIPLRRNFTILRLANRIGEIVPFYPCHLTIGRLLSLHLGDSGERIGDQCKIILTRKQYRLLRYGK
jgi:hypothetical protein